MRYELCGMGCLKVTASASFEKTDRLIAHSDYQVHALF